MLRLHSTAFAAAALIMLVFPTSPAAAVITALGGSVHGDATSSISDKTNATGRLSDPLTDFGQDVGINPNADMAEVDGTTIKNHFSAVARWDDAASGNIRFAALTTILSSNPASLQTAQADYQVQWLYEVKFDTRTSLNLDFFESASNTLNAPDHAEFDFLQDSGTFNTIWDSGSGNGSLTREFDPGTYKFLFVSSGTIADLLDINYASFLGVQLNWKFTEDKPADGAVPEPASWAMMLCGFGLVGGAMRARRNIPRPSIAHAARRRSPWK